MAKHKVVMELPPREIKRADVCFRVKRDDKLFGTLEVSNGSLVWFPANTKYGRKIRWESFHQLMEDNATKFESR